MYKMNKMNTWFYLCAHFYTCSLLFSTCPTDALWSFHLSHSSHWLCLSLATCSWPALTPFTSHPTLFAHQLTLFLSDCQWSFSCPNQRLNQVFAFNCIHLVPLVLGSHDNCASTQGGSHTVLFFCFVFRFFCNSCNWSVQTIRNIFLDLNQTKQVQFDPTETIAFGQINF